MKSEEFSYDNLHEAVEVKDLNYWNTLNFKDKTEVVLNTIHKLAGKGRYQKCLLISLFLALLGSSWGLGLMGYTTPTPKNGLSEARGYNYILGRVY